MIRPAGAKLVRPRAVPTPAPCNGLEECWKKEEESCFVQGACVNKKLQHLVNQTGIAVDKWLNSSEELPLDAGALDSVSPKFNVGQLVLDGRQHSRNHT